MTDRPSRRVPVVLITGPVGVGKSTAAGEVAALLSDADIAHASVDLAQIGACWRTPTDDPWQERLVHRNLACTWSNFREAGARRLVLCRVLEARSLLRHVASAVPGAESSWSASMRRCLYYPRAYARARPAVTRSGTWKQRPTSQSRWSGPASRTIWLTTRTGRPATSWRRCFAS